MDKEALGMSCLWSRISVQCKWTNVPDHGQMADRWTLSPGIDCRRSRLLELSFCYTFPGNTRKNLFFLTSVIKLIIS